MPLKNRRAGRFHCTDPGDAECRPRALNPQLLNRRRAPPNAGPEDVAYDETSRQVFDVDSTSERSYEPKHGRTLLNSIATNGTPEGFSEGLEILRGRTLRTADENLDVITRYRW